MGIMSRRRQAVVMKKEEKPMIKKEVKETPIVSKSEAKRVETLKKVKNGSF